MYNNNDNNNNNIIIIIIITVVLLEHRPAVHKTQSQLLAER